MDTGDKKKKQKPYSEYEKQLLKQLVHSNIEVVENRRTDGTTQKKKTEAWEDITRQFNNSPNVTQTASTAQLKKMWQNLKMKARDAKTLEAQRKWTSGEPAIGSEEFQDLSIMPTVMPTINLEIDSDIMQASTSQISQEHKVDDSIYWQNKINRAMDFEVHVMKEEVVNTDFLPGCSCKGLKSPIPSVTPKKRKAKKSIDDLKRALLKREIVNIVQKTKHDEEKHIVELEILKIKRDLLKKELNYKN